MSSFTLKTIRVSISMAQDVFGGGDNTAVIEGLHVKADITKPGGADANKLSLAISGLKLETMEKLTVQGFRPLKTFNNIVVVEAGAQGGKLDTVYSGEIKTAIPIFSDGGAPVFMIESETGSYPNKIASPPMSVKGAVAVDDLMRQFADEAGYAFKNEGVALSVKNSVFHGSPIGKARALAKQVGINLLIDDRVLVIMAKETYRAGEIPLLGKDSGLLGYPSFTNDGIEVKCIYDPRLRIGGLVELKSVVPRAGGIWRLTKLEHNLEAYQSAQGSWQSRFSAVCMEG